MTCFYFSPSEFSVTLLTMFTMSRFDHLLLVLSSWDGPVIGVLYGSPAEVLQLSALIQQSDEYHKLRDVEFHIVYRNGVSFVRG